MAGGRFGVQHVSQPREAPDGRVDAIARLQGRGDFFGVADGRDDPRLRAHRVERLEPQAHQAADPGVLQHEQPARPEFIEQRRAGAFAEFTGDGRGVPARIEGPPVAPRRAGGRQGLVVQAHDRQGLPEPRLVVVRGGLHQRLRQIAPDEAQQAGGRRRAAPVHAGDDDRDPFPAPRERSRLRQSGPRRHRATRSTRPRRAPLTPPGGRGSRRSRLASSRLRRAPRRCAPRPPGSPGASGAACGSCSPRGR